MWSGIHAYSDLAYEVGVVCQFCNNPRPVYIKLVKHILQYISEMLDLSLKFDGEVDTLDNIVGYTNSNFAG